MVGSSTWDRRSTRKALCVLVLLFLFLSATLGTLSLSGFLLVMSANSDAQYVMETASGRQPLRKIGSFSFGFVIPRHFDGETRILWAQCPDGRAISLAYFSSPDRIVQSVADVCRRGFIAKPNQSNI